MTSNPFLTVSVYIYIQYLSFYISAWSVAKFGVAEVFGFFFFFFFLNVSMLKLRAALTLHQGDVSTRRPFIGLYLTLPWVIIIIIIIFI